jgi:hypothetical protein
MPRSAVTVAKAETTLEVMGEFLNGFALDRLRMKRAGGRRSVEPLVWLAGSDSAQIMLAGSAQMIFGSSRALGHYSIHSLFRLP